MNLAFHKTLKKLTLSGYEISWKNILIVGPFPNLEMLKLKNYAFSGLLIEASEEGFYSYSLNGMTSKLGR